MQNYPNPFNPEMTIPYKIPKLTNVKLKIYNELGQELETLVDEIQAPGSYEIKWAPKKNIPSGIYFYQLRTEDFVETKRATFVK